MRHWTRPALLQVMAWRLFSAKPLPEPMVAYCQLDFWEQIRIRILSFSLKKMHLKLSSAKMAAILSRGRGLKPLVTSGFLPQRASHAGSVTMSWHHHELHNRSHIKTYHKISNIRHTNSPNLNVPRLVLQLSLPNAMKPGVKSKMKM